MHANSHEATTLNVEPERCSGLMAWSLKCMKLRIYGLYQPIAHQRYNQQPVHSIHGDGIGFGARQAAPASGKSRAWQR